MSASLAPRPSPAERSVATSRDAWLDIAKETAQETQKDDVWSLSAGVAFRIFLSLFPSMIAAVAVLNIVVDRAAVNELIGNLSDVAPSAVVDLLDGVVSTSEGAGSALVFGVLVGVWAATSAAVSLMKALSRARDVAETRKLVQLRLIGLLITVALFLAIAVLLVLLVFGPLIQEALLPRVVGGALSFVVSIGRYVAAILVLQVLFAFCYWIGPDRSQDRPPWRWLSPGAVLGVVGWLASSFVFSLYTRYFGNYDTNPAYAGFGSVIVLLVWLQITMMFLLVGGELNFVMERRRRARRELTEGAGFGLVDPLDAMGDADLAPPEPVGPRVGIGASGAPGAGEASGGVRAGAAGPPPAAPPGLEDRPGGRRRSLRAGAGLAGTAAALAAVLRLRRR